MTYIPARNHGPAANYPIMRVVMHGTVSPCELGGARAIADYFAHTTRPASTQFVVDPGEWIRCVPDDTIAYGAPPNKGSIHVEQCDPQAGNPARWQNADHQAMLRLAAKLVAYLCLKYDIPIRKISAADLLAGRKGICGHKDVSDAWHQTTHVDPGSDYPWGQFIALVREAANPTPAPTTQENEVTVFARFAGDHPKAGALYVTNLLERRGVVSEAYRDKMIAAGVSYADDEIYGFTSDSGMNAFAGELKANNDGTFTDYNPTTNVWERHA